MPSCMDCNAPFSLRILGMLTPTRISNEYLCVKCQSFTAVHFTSGGDLIKLVHETVELEGDTHFLLLGGGNAGGRRTSLAIEADAAVSSRQPSRRYSRAHDAEHEPFRSIECWAETEVVMESG